MFRRTICAMTAWAGLTGTAIAQTPTEPPRVANANRNDDFTPGGMPKRNNPFRDARFARPVILQAGAEQPAKPEPPPGPGKSPSDAPVPLPAPRAATPAPQADSGYVDAPAYAPANGYSRPGAPTGRLWTNVEWLVWATSGQHVPPAITTGPVGPLQPGAGVLGNPGTTVLWPLDRANNEFRLGFRLSGGYWFDDAQEFGLDWDFFFLGNSKKGLTVSSDRGGNQIIARPFVDALTGQQSAVLVSAPNVSIGTLGVRAENSAIGAGVGLVYNLASEPCNRLNFSIGYRYLGVFDEVSFEQDSTSFTSIPFGTRRQVLDRFNADNNFHGVNLGLTGDHKFGYWFLGWHASVALGGVRQVVTTDGRTVTTIPNAPTDAVFQGLFAQASNIGRREHTEFAVVPELGLRVGVQITESGRLYVGYNWIYLSRVVRAGDQIDVRVNPNALPGGAGSAIGPPLPAFRGFQQTDYWLQGVSFGMEVKF